MTIERAAMSLATRSADMRAPRELHQLQHTFTTKLKAQFIQLSHHLVDAILANRLVLPALAIGCISDRENIPVDAAQSHPAPP